MEDRFRDEPPHGVNLDIFLSERSRIGSYDAISRSASGTLTNSTASDSDVSSDGRYVVFQSNATNLVAGVSGWQIYRKDVLTGEIVVVSTSSSGEVGDGSSLFSSISADGRYVAFRSNSTNLTESVGGSTYQVYRKDLLTGEIIVVSTNDSGSGSNGANLAPRISADGMSIIFESDATNLVSGVSGAQIYVKNLLNGTITVASSSSSGTAGNGTSQFATLSSDGRYAIFRSNSGNLISGVSGEQIYRKDLVTGEIILVSSSSSGTMGNGTSHQAHLSNDGRYVVFRSSSSNLISGVSGTHIYIKDLVTGELILVSSTSNGIAGNDQSQKATISGDGRYVAFRSNSSNFISGVSGWQIYVKDLLTGEIRLVSRTATGSGGNGDSDTPIISADGRSIIFQSASSNLISGDTNGATDVFYRANPFTNYVEDSANYSLSQLRFISFLTEGSSRNALSNLSYFENELMNYQSRLGAGISRLSTATTNLDILKNATSEAESRIMYVDVAKEAENTIYLQILKETAASLINKANLQTKLLIDLLYNKN